jgi:NADH:ubiquinone oxidoreductase subunit H
MEVGEKREKREKRVGRRHSYDRALVTSTPELSILIALLTLGVLSLLERVLLSTIQYRHGPGSQTADGLALLLADGTKLYSK